MTSPLYLPHSELIYIVQVDQKLLEHKILIEFSYNSRENNSAEKYLKYKVNY